jgi:hypothetical protein
MDVFDPHSQDAPSMRMAVLTLTLGGVHSIIMTEFDGEFTNDIREELVETSKLWILGQLEGQADVVLENFGGVLYAAASNQNYAPNLSFPGEGEDIAEPTSESCISEMF